MSTADFGRYEQALAGKPFPKAFVDLDAFDRNLEALAARAGRLPIRLATKSVRCTALIQRALRHPGFHGVLAYSGFEAAHLARSGVADIVLGYPIVQPSEIEAALEGASREVRPVFMTDRPEHLESLAKIADGRKAELAIAVDLDLSTRFPGVHFGVRRSWVDREERLGVYLDALKKYPRLRLEGVMGYEAQIAGVPDSGPVIAALKRLSLPRLAERRARFVRTIREAGHTIRFVNGGGTGSFESTRADSSVTELTAGSGLFSPTLFDGYRGFRHEPAAGFALAVTRKPEPRIATCFSGGYVASGSAGFRKLPSPVYPEGLELLAHEGAGEVQTPVQGRAAERLAIGDGVYFRHAKAGELCERFNELHLIRGARLESSVPTYRGEGMNFG